MTPADPKDAECEADCTPMTHTYKCANRYLAKNLTALRTERDALRAALSSLLEMYPPDVFTGESGDEGPRRIVEARRALEPEGGKK